MADPSSITARLLTADDWKILRDIRLHALAQHPDALGPCYEKHKFAHDKDRQPEDWQDFLASDFFFIFGIFNNDAHIIGTTALQLFPGKPGTAELIMSYLDPHHRGHGLYDFLYRTRLDFCRNHAAIDQLIVGYIEGNEVAKHNIIQRGFSYHDKEEHPNTDGSVTVVHKYVLDLEALR